MENQTLSCQYCSATHTTEEELQNHLLLMHVQDQQPQPIQSDNIANPETIPGDPNAYKCIQCNTEFGNADLAHTHTKETGHGDIVVIPQEQIDEPTQNQATEKAVPSIQEAIQGDIVEQKNNKVGRPTKYNEQMLQIAKDYYNRCLGKTGEKKKMPLIEELARLCDVDTDTINNWTDNNEEFFGLIKRIKNFQREALIQRGFSMKNPTFAIFLLKAQHGMMETEKQIITPDKNININISRE